MKYYALPVSVLTLAATLLASVFLFNAINAEGSVITGGEYQVAQIVDATSGTSSLKTTYGSVGQIVVENSSAAATFELYDTASTTIATTTATQLLSFDAAAGEGTYQYDVRFNKGLMLYVPTAFDGDVVVTYR